MQMSHIDAVRGSVNDSNTYYSIVNREMAEMAQNEEDDKVHRDTSLSVCNIYIRPRDNSMLITSIRALGATPCA